MYDVDEARRQLAVMLDTALAAAREHTTAQNAVAVEELAAWEQIGASLVPAFTREALGSAADIARDPRLPGLLDARDKSRAALESARVTHDAALLDPDELDELAARRKRIEARIVVERGRLQELRGRPGLLDRVDDVKKGVRVKDDVRVHIRAYEELRATVDALETELSRLAAASARHHRAKNQLGDIADQVRAIDEGYLRDARRIVVDRLMQPETPRPSRPGLGDLFRVVDGVMAKRACLHWLYESWVRPHGSALHDLQHEGQNVSGFETVSWPAKVELRVHEAAVALDAWRRSSRSVIAFSDYASVVDNDWWSALVPGVPNPDGSPPALPVSRDVSEVASDKLAAAWASMSGAGPALVEDPFLPGATEVNLALPVGVDSLLWPVAERPTAIPGFDDEEQNPFLEASREIARPVVVVSDVGRPTFAPGSRVGRCLVEALIGKGGMGEVYRARLEGDGGFARAVVLKRLTVDTDDDPAVARAFAREAEVAARIAHPNVVQIFDVQSMGGEPFIIMELLEGLSLQKLVNRARNAKVPLEPRVLTRCALDAARGLHAAHSLRGEDGALVGLVHRDVSPDNLFLCHNGFTKLLDFGIARRNDLMTMTGKSELKGKIPYMSPEQILGDPLDARSDLFSLGSTLYWVMTGARPFVGDNEVTTLFAVVNKPHAPVRQLRADGGALGDVVEQLLQKRPDDRPASALQVVQMLDRSDPASPEEAAAFLARVWAA